MPGKSGSRSTKFQAHTQRRVQSGNSQAEIRHASTAPRQNTDKLDAPGGVRLNKAIAAAGLCSRRKADELILAGQVLVNGVLEANPARHVLPDDCIAVNGRELTAAQEYCYLLLHKPVQTVCTVSDPEGRPTVMEYLPAGVRHLRLYPVGRLDYFSEGLLLLTNDGALTHRLLSPKSHVDKVYYARTEGTPTEADAARLAQGITLADGLRCLPAELKICGQGQVLLTLREGKFHQAKRMLAFCGTPVVYLKRLSMGPLRLGEDLRPGEFRHLTQEEIDKLQQAVGLVAADCQKNDNNFCKIHKKPLANP